MKNSIYNDIYGIASSAFGLKNVLAVHDNISHNKLNKFQVLFAERTTKVVMTGSDNNQETLNPMANKELHLHVRNDIYGK